MNEPDVWPTWAKYIVIDADGIAVLCSHKPVLDAEGYVRNGGSGFRHRDVGGPLPASDLKTTPAALAKALIFKRIEL